MIREQGSGPRAALERWLESKGAALAPPAAELGTASALRVAARAGVDPAVLSHRAVEDDLASGRLFSATIRGGRSAAPSPRSGPSDLHGPARLLVEIALLHARAGPIDDPALTDDRSVLDPQARGGAGGSIRDAPPRPSAA